MMGSKKTALAAIAAALMAMLAACSNFSGNAEAINPSSSGSWGNTNLSWKQSKLPSGGYYSVTYGNGKFIAVGAGSTAAVSTDGINWTAEEISPPESPQYAKIWYASSFGNGVFVLVNTNTPDAMTFTDGSSWKSHTLPGYPYTGYRAVTYGKGGFVALGYENGTTAAYSTDGVNWTASNPLPSSQSWSSVAASDSLFVAVSSGSNAAA